MVKYLLSLKTAVVSTNTHILDSTISEAVSRGHLSIVRELGEAGWELSTRTGTSSPLHRAAAGGYFEIVAYLVGKGVEVNNRDEAKRTPLHLAVAFPQIVDLLLTNKDTDLNAVDLDERSPLHIAAALPESIEAHQSVKSMLNREPDVDMQDDQGATPLHLAAMKANYDVIKSLLEAEADPNILNYSNESPLHCVVRLDNEQQRDGVGACVKLLLDYNAESNTQDNRKQTPLHWAASYGLMDPIKALLEKGADTAIRGRYGRIAFTEAIMAGYLEAAELLLQHGSDINGGDTKFTPLYLRSGMDNPAILRFLLGHKADFKILTPSGFSPLYRAAEYGQRENVRLLVESGDDIHQVCKGNPVLQVAVIKGHLEVVEVLLNSGADVNAANYRGETSLHRAIGIENLAIVTLLLRHGADTLIQDNKGNTALDKARELEYGEIVDVIDKAIVSDNNN